MSLSNVLVGVFFSFKIKFGIDFAISHQMKHIFANAKLCKKRIVMFLEMVRFLVDTAMLVYFNHWYFFMTCYALTVGVAN